jgi:hypothetical protein
MWKKVSPARPFTNNLVDDDRRSMRTHLIHLGPKPRFLITLRRKAHETLSKALVTSSLRTRAGTFR